jgi:hypothetical protein
MSYADFNAGVNRYYNPGERGDPRGGALRGYVENVGGISSGDLHDAMTYGDLTLPGISPKGAGKLAPGITGPMTGATFSEGEWSPSVPKYDLSGPNYNYANLYLAGVTPQQFTQDASQFSSGTGALTPVGGIKNMQGYSNQLLADPQGVASAGLRGYADGGIVGGQSPLLGQALMYADGGMVGQPPGPSSGMPQAGLQQQTPQGPLDSHMVNSQIDDVLNRNPQVAAHIRQIIQQAVQQGAINPQQAQLVVQLAQACLNNPALWPQLRQFAISRGLAGPQDLPQQFDQGLVTTILVAAKAAAGMQGQGAGGMPGQPQMQGGMQQNQGSMAYSGGGMIRGPGTGTSDSIPAQNTTTGEQVKVSNGEFVVPANVVAAKGRDFFDALVRKYHQPTGQPEQK